MSDSGNSRSGGITFLGALGLLFIGLKLGHVITWPWWAVTLPLWGGLALFAVGIVSILLVAGVAELARAVKRKRALKAARNRPAVSGRRMSIGERKDIR